ncbi:MAG: hypothetical protein P9M06_05750, partial [Candidatus Saelkia tenebricola]|nr:hypothetical protein [Candidatus Saelkia tenebricola]
MKKVVLAVAGSLLIINTSFADAPFVLAFLPDVSLPQTRSPQDSNDSGIMIPLSTGSGEPSETEIYEDGITWSWEEEVSPIDFIQFSQSLPYDEWIEIDDVTLRGLFEDVVQRALNKMEIEGDGGEFEEVLRQDLLYFTPEHEYYWPPYEGDFTKRELKFPVKVMREESPVGEILTFQLGRFADQDREVYISTNDVCSFLPSLIISVEKEKYLPGIFGPPKVERLMLELYTDEVKLWRYYGNMVYDAEEHDYVEQGVFRDDGVIKEYQNGNPEAVVNNISSEPKLDLSGVENLFDIPKSLPLSLDWGIWDPVLYQTYDSIINLCKLQLNLADNGYELEKILWRDFFRFDYNPEYFGMNDEDVNVARIATGKDDREVFLFDVGNVHTARHIYLTLSKEFSPAGYEWGVEQISFSRAIMVEGAVGEEARVFEFGF